MPKMQGFSHGHFLLLAKNAYEHPGDHNSGYRTCIILSTVAFELFLSELEGLAADIAERGGQKSAVLHDVLREAERERLKVLFKLSLVHLVLTGTLPEKGKQPYQDLYLLVRIRNAIVHEKYGVNRTTDLAEAPAVLKAAVHRGLVPRLDRYVHAANTYYLANSALAKWAHTTILDTIAWVANLPSDEQMRDALQFISYSLNSHQRM